MEGGAGKAENTPSISAPLRTGAHALLLPIDWVILPHMGIVYQCPAGLTAVVDVSVDSCGRTPALGYTFRSFVFVLYK